MQLLCLSAMGTLWRLGSPNKRPAWMRGWAPFYLGARNPANNTEIEKRLWEAADELRANSKLKSSEYSAPVVGLAEAAADAGGGTGADGRCF